jgi:hypothetical protein
MSVRVTKRAAVMAVMVLAGIAGLAELASAAAATASEVTGPPPSTKPVCLYKTTFVRAAPGKLLDLIALYKERMAVIEASGDARPFWWRHTQGDQWDLMLLTPMGSYADYYAKDRIAGRKKAADAAGLPEEAFARKLGACSAWKEDVFVMGPPLAFVEKAFEGTAYYHIEIFVSLPGKQEELFKEREMENVYAVGTKRPYNMIFVRESGASWDLFTLGCYRDIKHWAVGEEVTREERQAAARRAGFGSAEEIGPYMRTLIDFHRDTMGVAIK